MSPRPIQEQPESKILTETENEFVQALWDLKEGTVNHVIERLAETKPDKKWAYTSVSTILRILEQKSFLKSRKEGRTHVYVPVVSRAEYEEKALKHLVKNVFAESKLSFAQRFFESSHLSADEWDAIAKLVKDHVETNELKSKSARKKQGD